MTASDSLFAKSDPTLIRKCQELANYRFEIEHVEGAKHVLCDFFTQYPFEKTFKDKGIQAELGSFHRSKLANSPGEPTKKEVKGSNSLPPKGNVKSSAKSIEDTIQVTNKCSPENTTLYQGEYEPKGNLSEENLDLRQIFEQDTHEGEELGVPVTEGVDCICKLEVFSKDSNIVEPSTIHIIKESASKDLILPNLETIKEMQKEDSILKIVRKWIEQGERGIIQANRTPAALVSYWRQFNLLKIEDGILKRKWVMKKEEECRDLILVPENSEVTIMKLFHDNTTNCHPGISPSVNRCRQYFYWPKMEDEFRLYIQACPRCNEIKQPHQYLKAPLKHMFFSLF